MPATANVATEVITVKIAPPPPRDRVPAKEQHQRQRTQSGEIIERNDTVAQRALKMYSSTSTGSKTTGKISGSATMVFIFFGMW